MQRSSASGIRVRLQRSDGDIGVIAEVDLVERKTFGEVAEGGTELAFCKEGEGVEEVVFLGRLDRKEVGLTEEEEDHLFAEIARDLGVIDEHLSRAAGRGDQGDLGEGLKFFVEGDVDDGAFGVISGQDHEIHIGLPIPTDAVVGAEDIADEFGTQAILIGVEEHQAKVSTADMGRLEEVFEDGFANVAGWGGEVGPPFVGFVEGFQFVGEAWIGAHRTDQAVHRVDIAVHVEAAKNVHVAGKEFGEDEGRDRGIGQAFDGSKGQDELAGVAAGSADHALFVATIDARAFAVEEEGRKFDPTDSTRIAEVFADLVFLQEKGVRLGRRGRRRRRGRKKDLTAEDGFLTGDGVSESLPGLQAALEGCDEVHP